MKVKATWRKKNANPFVPDVERLRDTTYSKTVEVPDDVDMEILKKFAEEDSATGYELSSIKKVDDSAQTSPLKEKND